MINTNVTICPFCQCHQLDSHTKYMTINNGQRTIYRCTGCGEFFAPTANTFMAGIRKPVSLIAQVLKAGTEGMGVNAACRTFSIAKNTLLDRERRFKGIKEALLLPALLHMFFRLVIEGDEVYTRVGKNLPPDESPGRTIVLIDRATRFIWELECGRKDRKLFLKAIKTVENLVNRTQNITLITDGERRYGNILFEICHEVIQNGRKGRPRKTLKKGVKVRLKNKGSQSHKKGPKRPKYQAPCKEHPDTDQNIEVKDIHANHCEAFNSSLRRRNSAFRRKTDTYARNREGLQRTLDVYWVVHNFVRSHFTLKKVPAVALGIIDKALSWEELLMIPAAG